MQNEIYRSNKNLISSCKINNLKTSHELRQPVEMSLFQQEKGKKEKKFNEVRKEEDCYTNMRQTIAVYLED